MPQLVPFYFTSQFAVSAPLKYNKCRVFSSYCSLNLAMVRHDVLDLTHSIDDILDNVDGLDLFPNIFLAEDAYLDGDATITSLDISKQELYDFYKFFYKLKTVYDYNTRYYIMVGVNYHKGQHEYARFICLAKSIYITIRQDNELVIFRALHKHILELTDISLDCDNYHKDDIDNISFMFYDANIIDFNNINTLDIIDNSNN